MNLWIVYLHLISSFKSDTTVKFRIHESEYVRFHKNVFCNSILLFLKSMPIFRNKLTHKLTFVNSHTSSMWPRRFYWMYEALRSNTVQSTWTLILLSKIMFQLCSVCKWCYFFSLIISHLFCWAQYSYHNLVSSDSSWKSTNGGQNSFRLLLLFVHLSVTVPGCCRGDSARTIVSCCLQ